MTSSTATASASASHHFPNDNTEDEDNDLEYGAQDMDDGNASESVSPHGDQHQQRDVLVPAVAVATVAAASTPNGKRRPRGECCVSIGASFFYLKAGIMHEPFSPFQDDRVKGHARPVDDRNERYVAFFQSKCLKELPSLFKIRVFLIQSITYRHHFLPFRPQPWASLAWLHHQSTPHQCFRWLRRLRSPRQTQPLQTR